MKESVRKEIEELISKKTYIFKDDNKRAEQYRDDAIFSIGWLCNIADGPLSEDLLREFKHSFIQCHWNEVSRHQNLSKEFICEMEDYLDMDEVIRRGLISGEKYKIHDRWEILDL